MNDARRPKRQSVSGISRLIDMDWDFKAKADQGDISRAKHRKRRPYRTKLGRWSDDEVYWGDDDETAGLYFTVCPRKTWAMNDFDER
jgi:hypothetical protein